MKLIIFLHALKPLIFPFLYCPWPIFNFSLLIYRNSLHIKAINLIPVICIAMLPSLPYVPWFMTFVYKEINEFSNSLYLRELKINHKEGNGKPLQYSCLENPMDGGAWWAAVHGVTGSQTRPLGVRHDWATLISLFTFMHGRRKWQPTPVFLPGEAQGQGSLVGCHLWHRTESDTTEAT